MEKHAGNRAVFLCVTKQPVVTDARHPMGGPNSQDLQNPGHNRQDRHDCGAVECLWNGKYFQPAIVSITFPTLLLEGRASPNMPQKGAKALTIIVNFLGH